MAKRPFDPREGARAVYGAPPPPKRPCAYCGEESHSLVANPVTDVEER